MDKDQVLAVFDAVTQVNYGDDDGDYSMADVAKARGAVESLYAELESLRAYKIKTESGEHECSLAVAAEWEKNEEYISELEAMRKRVELLPDDRERTEWNSQLLPYAVAEGCAEELRAALGDSHE